MINIWGQFFRKFFLSTLPLILSIGFLSLCLSSVNVQAMVQSEITPQMGIFDNGNIQHSKIINPVVDRAWLQNSAVMTYTRLTSATGSGDRQSLLASSNAKGEVVVFQSDSDFLNQGIADEQWEIWLFDTRAMTYTRVTTASHSNRDSDWPSISADGNVIAFQSNSDFVNEGRPANIREIWRYDTMAMTYTRITSASHSNRESSHPSLSANGAVIAFESDSDFLNEGRPDNSSEIWLYDTDTMTYTRVTSSNTGTGNRQSFLPSLNDDGTIVAFVSNSDFFGQEIDADQYEIWVYDTTTMTYTRITSASHDNRDSSMPRLNNDGTVVVFESDSDFLGQGIEDEQWEIWLYDTATMTYTRITSASPSNRDSTWPRMSADGTTIVFQSDSDFLGQGIEDERWEIWLYDTTVMTYTRVTSASHNNRDSAWPSVSADGKVVTFQSNSDFLEEGLSDNTSEIWQYKKVQSWMYLPILLKEP
jgi:RPA family protein